MVLLETSFLPLGQFKDIADLQSQHDAWAAKKAFPRHHRRVGARVIDAYRMERMHLGPLPEVLPDTDRRLETRISKDALVRASGADYSVPPGRFGRHARPSIVCSAGTSRLRSLIYLVMTLFRG